MKPIPIYQVDAFTNKPFAGNPAGVCLLDEPKPDDWMLAVAVEMNLSETAFLLPEGEGWRLRWFTPRVEVDLCGHATLASSHVLSQIGLLKLGGVAHYHTLSGELTARPLQEGWIELNFPANEVSRFNAPTELIQTLGIKPLFSGKDKRDFLFEVEDEKTLRAIQPDFERLSVLTERGVMVTCRGDKRYDFYSRFFAPAVGINEDPVTGSAHCSLVPFWGERLKKKEMKAFQASKRGGELWLEWSGERILIRGQSATVFHGELTA